MARVKGERGEGRGAGEKDEGGRMKDEREVSGGERSTLKLAAETRIFDVG